MKKVGMVLLAFSLLVVGVTGCSKSKGREKINTTVEVTTKAESVGATVESTNIFIDTKEEEEQSDTKGLTVLDANLLYPNVTINGFLFTFGETPLELVESKFGAPTDSGENLDGTKYYEYRSDENYSNYCIFTFKVLGDGYKLYKLDLAYSYDGVGNKYIVHGVPYSGSKKEIIEKFGDEAYNSKTNLVSKRVDSKAGFGEVTIIFTEDNEYNTEISSLRVSMLEDLILDSTEDIEEGQVETEEEQVETEEEISEEQLRESIRASLEESLAAEETTTEAEESTQESEIETVSRGSLSETVQDISGGPGMFNHYTIQLLDFSNWVNPGGKDVTTVCVWIEPSNGVREDVLVKFKLRSKGSADECINAALGAKISDSKYILYYDMLGKHELNSLFLESDNGIVYSIGSTPSKEANEEYYKMVNGGNN